MWADSCSITPPASAHAFLVVSDAAISIVRLSVVYDALEATIIVDAIWPSSSESPSTAGRRATQPPRRRRGVAASCRNADDENRQDRDRDGAHDPDVVGVGSDPFEERGLALADANAHRR